MEIKINGQTADITADSEKTVGEILAGLDQWIVNTGHRLSGLAINGETISTVTMEAAFTRNLDTVEILDIVTCSLPELSAQSLEQINRDIDEYESLGFNEKQSFFENWKASPQAMLVAEQIPDLFTICCSAFSGDLSLAALRTITGERLREFEDPAGELAVLQALVSDVCVRLEDLPLDIQTGKDVRAAETIQVFSGVAGKVFRIYYVLKAQGFDTEAIRIGEAGLSDYICEFNSVVKDLLAAYQQRDTVLVGDLAEYELSPRLRGFCAALSQAVEEKTWTLQA